MRDLERTIRISRGQRFWVLGLVLAIVGCAEVPLYVAGHTGDNRETFAGKGTFNMEAHTARFEVAVAKLGITCTGVTQRTVVGGGGFGVGDRHAAKLTCSDGRTATAELIQSHMGGGTGTGTDECGNTFQLVFDTNQVAVDRQAASYLARAKEAGPFIDKCDAPGDAPPHNDPIG